MWSSEKEKLCVNKRLEKEVLGKQNLWLREIGLDNSGEGSGDYKINVVLVRWVSHMD